MVYCDKEQEDFDEREFVEVDDFQIHVIAPKGARSSDRGHRVDGFPVRDLRATRDADGWWQLQPGSVPNVEVPTFQPPSVQRFRPGEPPDVGRDAP